MLSWLIVAAVAAGPQPAAAWQAPGNPNPNEILSDGVEDSRAGRNEQALAKFVWFHDNALKYDPALSGVRNSFALSYWHDLAKAYPPAMESLTRARDHALGDLRTQDDKGVFRPFSDFAAINRYLGEEARTVSTFLELDKDRPQAAQRVFRLARPALLRAKEYEVCGKYLQPDRDLEMAAHLFRSDASQGSNPKRKDFAEKAFTNETATLVALLVLDGRRDEAETIAKKAKLEWNDPKFQAAIDSALTGVVPDPWP